jgi:hypothetical protein
MKVCAGLLFVAALAPLGGAFDYEIAYTGDIFLIDKKTGIGGA